MARRGDALREHILWLAKDAFLELGFERTSMDEVAARAATSKRSLYAHFESKERLFLAVVELVRELFRGRLRSPGDYPGPPAEALVTFCARYLEILLYESSVQMLRVSMAEVARFPEGAARYHEVMFGDVQARLGAYLRTTFGLSAPLADGAAQRLLGRLLYPQLPRALFGVDPLAKEFDPDTLSPDHDLAPIRQAVTDLIDTLPKSPRLSGKKRARSMTASTHPP